MGYPRETEWLHTMRNSPDDVLVRIMGSYDFPLGAVWAAGIELVRRAEPIPHTNLYEWKRQMAAGERTAYTFDELWQKACDEAWLAEQSVSIGGQSPISPP